MDSTCPLIRHPRWRLFVPIVLVLSLFISGSSLFVHHQHRQQVLESIVRKTEVEIDLIGAFLTDAMLRNDYTEGRQLLAAWPRNHDSVALLTVVLENGQTFFAFEDDHTPEVPVTASKTFEYRDRILTVTLCRDGADMQEPLAFLARNLVVLTVSLILATAGTLWLILFRWMLRPMQEAIETRTRDLQKAHTDLERQVAERTASLSAEITMRRQAETNLRKLGMAVEQSPTIIFITDTRGVIEYVNPKFEQLTGYTREESIGQTPRILKSQETPARIHRDLWETILSGHEWRAELRDRRKDGSEFWANVSIAPIKEAGGRISHFVAMHEDITERKEAEAAMVMARRAAELANKAKTELMANMSHELRTPLNAIIGFSETMREGVFGPLGCDKYLDYVTFIHDSGSHLLELINDILDVSAVESGGIALEESPVDLRAVCDSGLRLLGPRAREAEVSLDHITPPAALPALRGDPRRIKQILVNLLSNAVKFTPQGGRVTCAAAREADGALTLTVTDTGIGMDQAGMVTAMTKFGQVDSSLARKHEGTGLGLPLTKSLVDLHGGSLDLHSRPGAGTSVVVRFPPDRTLAEAPEDSAPGDRPEDSAAPAPAPASV